jgi:hypothetical protein
MVRPQILVATVLAFCLLNFTTTSAVAAYRIAFEKYSPTAARPGDPRARRKDRYILTMHPIPGNKNVYIGVQPPFSTNHPNRSMLDVGYAHIMAQVWWQAYEKIAVEKGLFVLGDAFHRQMEVNEHPFDQQSALVAIFDGPDFNKPLSTLRVAYPRRTLNGKLELPLVRRIDQIPYVSEDRKISLRAISTQPRPMADPGVPIVDLAEIFADHFAAEFGQRTYEAFPTDLKFDPNHPDIAPFIPLLREFARKDLMQQLTLEKTIDFKIALAAVQQFARRETAHLHSLAELGLAHSIGKILGLNLDYMQSATFKVPFLETTINRSTSWTHHHREALFGGWPAEIKGLTHSKSEDGIDSMWAIFWKAEQEGIFDRVPLAINGMIPEVFLAETTRNHLQRIYNSWGWQDMKELSYFDQDLKQEVVLPFMYRRDLGRLFMTLFKRSLNWDQNPDSFRETFFPRGLRFEESVAPSLPSSYDWEIYRRDKDWSYSELRIDTITGWLCQFSYTPHAPR